jgi:hypothetical protein
VDLDYKVVGHVEEIIFIGGSGAEEPDHVAAPDDLVRRIGVDVLGIEAEMLGRTVSASSRWASGHSSERWGCLPGGTPVLVKGIIVARSGEKSTTIWDGEPLSTLPPDV